MKDKGVRSAVARMLKMFSGQQSVLTIPRPYIFLTEDIHAALLLSQCIYWSDRTSDPAGWFAKSYSDWFDELGMSQYQINRAAQTLKPIGLETKLKKFSGAPTVHYRVDMDKLSDSIMKKLDNPIMKKLDNPLSTNSTMENEVSQQTYTETTTETTTEIKDAPSGAPEDIWTDGIFTTPPAEPYPVTAPEIAELIACWYDWTPNKPVQRGKAITLSKHIANKTIRAFAESLLSRGATGADMIRMLQDATDPDSRYARLMTLDALTFNYAGEALESWCAEDEHRDQYRDDSPRLTPRKPGVRVLLGGDVGKDVIADVPRPYIAPRQLDADEQAIKELETFADLQNVLQSEDDEDILRKAGLTL